jgi:hypothetical protein
MVMPYLDYWVMGQMALEAVLVILVLVFLAKIKMLRRLMTAPASGSPQNGAAPPGKGAQLTRCDETGTLESVLTHLTQRSLALQQQLDHLDTRVKVSPPGSPSDEPGLSLRSRVEHLFRHGLGPEEIGRRLGMNPAEVKVALDLARLGAP